MTLAEWLDINVRENFYHPAAEIIVVGQKNGSLNTSDNIFENKIAQRYAKEIFGHYNMMFFKPIVYNEIPMIKVFINIPTKEEVKRR